MPCEVPRCGQSREVSVSFLPFPWLASLSTYSSLSRRRSLMNTDSSRRWRRFWISIRFFSSRSAPVAYHQNMGEVGNEEGGSLTGASARSLPYPYFCQLPLIISAPGKHQATLFKAVLGFQSWRRQWQPTPVLLPGKSHGWRSFVGCSPWGR